MASLYRTFTTPEQIDAEYDVERAVPDFTVYARQYIDGSREARQRLRGFHRVPFGPTTDEYLDIFPAERRSAPVLVFFHGGYWRILAAEDFSFVAQGPAAAGVTVVVANYALCPKVTVDEITRQARAAIAWTYRNIRSYGGDPGRLFVSGHSVGGQLTAMAALTEWERDYGLPRDTVKGGIAISGVFDLRPIPFTSMQRDIRITEDQIQRNSPQFHIRPVPAPLLVTYGGDETAEFCRQSDEFLAAWMEAGNRGSQLHQPGANHFTAITGFADPESPLCRGVFAFMEHDPRGRPAAAGRLVRLQGRPGDIPRFRPGTPLSRRPGG